MLAHGAYKMAGTTRVRCGMSTFEVPAGYQIEVLQTDHDYHKQLVKFSERDIAWFYEGTVARWVGADVSVQKLRN